MYYNGKKIRNIFGSTETQSIGEPSIRDEVTKIIREEGRGAYYIYRRARRDSEGRPVLSPTTTSNRSRESDFDIPSNASETMGYLFDDHVVLGYIDLTMGDHLPGKVQSAGDSRNEDKALILEWNVLSSITGNNTEMPDEHDQIIIPRYDLDGNIVSPLRVSELYNIASVEAFRLDGTGRIEYHKLNLISKSERSHRL